MVMKSFSLLRARSFTCKLVQNQKSQSCTKESGTDPKPRGRIRLHNFTHIPDELREGRPDLAMFNHKRLGYALLCTGAGRCTALEMRSILSAFSHDEASCTKKKGEVRRWTERSSELEIDGMQLDGRLRNFVVCTLFVSVDCRHFESRDGQAV